MPSSPSFPRFTVSLLLGLGLAAAQSVSKREYLWPKGAPGALDNTEASKPSVVVYSPAKAKNNGAAALVLGGGGYSGIAFDAESIPAAKWLNSIGVTAIVLTYRLAPAYRHPIEMQDAQRAMRWARANADRFGIDVHRLGVVGFSAGGHLGSTIAVHNDQGNSGATDTVDRHSCRPNFQILVYPVITMDTLNHGSSRGNLLGPNPSADLLDFLSSEKHITATTPPAFLVHGKDDERVPVANSRMYYDSLIKAGIPAMLKLYDHGPHGFGLADGEGGTPKDSIIATWPGFAGDWLKSSGFLTAAPIALRPTLRSPLHRIARGRDMLGRKPAALPH